METKQEDITLRGMQEQVDAWIKTYGFKEGEHHDLGDEMADVIWVLTCIANQTGIDLTEALKRNIEKKTKRDNQRHINNPKLK